MKNNLNYWSCKIGPVNREVIPSGAVENKFIEMFGEQAQTCSSGWGLTEEMKTRLDIISLLPITDSETLEKIDELLSKRKMY